MGAAIELRTDFTGDDLRRLAKASRDARQTRRLLALATIYDGGSRSDGAKLAGVTLQIVRDWVMRFNAEGAPGLLDRKAPGNAPLLTTEHRAALVQAVEAGPNPGWMGWSAGVWWILRSGSTTGLAFRSAARHWVANCVPWGFGSCPPGRRLTNRTRTPWRRSKKLPRHCG